MSYITLLDFESERVYQYDMQTSDYIRHKDAEKFLTNKGHNLSNCEWMSHKDNEIITN